MTESNEQPTPSSGASPEQQTSKELTPAHREALQWARNQNYGSVAARMAKLCAEAFDILRQELSESRDSERLLCGQIDRMTDEADSAHEPCALPTYTCPNCETKDEFSVRHDTVEDRGHGAGYPVVPVVKCTACGQEARAELRGDESRIDLPPSTQPPREDIAPIAKIMVADGFISWARLYAPGLPNGQHDVYPAAPSPSSPPARTDEDYAIEHGRYLATAAEEFLKSVRDHDEAKEAWDNADDDAARDDMAIKVQQAAEANGDHWRGLENAIYEFRKRADRARPTPTKGAG